MRTGSKYPTAKRVAVDVDGTLIVNGSVNSHLVEWLKWAKGDGYSLTLWSARGKDYAIKAAKLCKVSELFDDIVGKPGVIIDDLGLGWMKYCKVITTAKQLRIPPNVIETQQADQVASLNKESEKLARISQD